MSNFSLKKIQKNMNKEQLLKILLYGTGTLLVVFILSSFEPIAQILDQFQLQRWIEFFLAFGLFALTWVGVFYILIKAIRLARARRSRRR